MNRGLNRRLTYSDKKDYILFLETFGEACSLFNVGSGSYCLMPNHYHLLVHTPEGNLSRFMRHVNSVYTQRYNRKHKRDGPLFRGRFKAILVEEDSYLLQVVKYIHRNPVKAGLSDSLSRYKWSSHKHFITSKPKSVPVWMEIDYILGYFSEKQKDAVAGYKSFMRKDLDDNVEKFYSKKNQSPILGDEGFIERVKQNYISGDRELDLEVRGERIIRGIAQVKVINNGVCGQYKIAEQILYESQRGKTNIARQMAICLSRELSGLNNIELAKAYKAKTHKTIATSVYKFKQLMKLNRTLEKQYLHLKSRISQGRT